MRICFIFPPCEYYSPVSGGAISTVTRHIIPGLEELGHEALVITPDDSQPLYSVGTVLPVPTVSTEGLRGIAAHLQARLCAWEYPNEGMYWSRVQQFLLDLRPSVVVLANDFQGAMRVRRVLPKARIACWLHNQYWIPSKTRECLGAIDLFLCCSNFVRTWFLAEYSVNPSRVWTVHAGVDHQAFRPVETAIQDAALRLLFVGRLDPNKGVDIAVEATRRLKAQGANVALTVVGHTWFYKRRCAHSAQFLGTLRQSMSEVDASWTGHVGRAFLPQVIREHDVALILSRSQEPFGLVALEAMASGLAVIASPRGGLPEACEEAAIFVDPDKTDDVVEVLLRFSEGREDLERWKNRSIQRAKRARWADAVSKLVEALEAV